jgi:hypothetical protein
MRLAITLVVMCVTRLSLRIAIRRDLLKGCTVSCAAGRGSINRVR